LKTCWNGKLAHLHDRDPKRHAFYQEYFGDDAYWSLAKNPLPKLLAMPGDPIGLIYEEAHLFPIMKLWNYTFAYTDKSWPYCRICEEPPKVLPPTTRLLKGNFVTFSSFMWGHYGHSTHDVLPWFAYLKELTSHDPTIKYILLDTRAMKDILAVLDPKFAANRVVWVKFGEYTEIQGTVTTIKNLGRRDNNFRFMDFLRHWSMKGRNDREGSRNKIVYYDRRNPKDTLASRLIRPDIEQEMLTRIQDAMQRHGRTEELVVFNGLLHGEQSMTPYEQFLLFRDATTIIGPHGSGLSGNLLWTNPMPRDCADRVHVLEFINDLETAKEASPSSAIENHWVWIAGWPLDYHHMFYSKESKRDALVIDVVAFSEALDSMWGTPVVKTSQGTFPLPYLT